MKRIIPIILLALLGTNPIALRAQDTYQDANTLYAEGEYAQAAAIYEELLAEYPAQTNREAIAQIEYNLGNAYFKQGELAKSILCYERALRYKPNMEDAEYNLTFAQSKIVDNIANNDAFFLSQWAQAIRNRWTAGSWLIASIVLFVICLTGILIFLLSRQVWVRKTAFHAAWISLVCCIWFGANSASLRHRDNVRSEAIITQGIVNAKSSPDRSGTDLFTLHEGTKVEIKERIGEWCNISVGAYVGWIPAAYMEQI